MGSANDGKGSEGVSMVVTMGEAAIMPSARRS
jgi:hypothetical protein